MDPTGLSYPFDDADFLGAVAKSQPSVATSTSAVLQQSIVVVTQQSVPVQQPQQTITLTAAEIIPEHSNSNQSQDSSSTDHHHHHSIHHHQQLAGKKRDWSKVVRKFHREWTEQFAVVERDQKPYCLICQKAISQMKVHTIRQHYRKLHGDFEHRFPVATEARTIELNRLGSLIPYGPFSGSYNFKEETAEDEDADVDEEEDEDSADDDLEPPIHHQQQQQLQSIHSQQQQPPPSQNLQGHHQLMESGTIDLILESSFNEPNRTTTEPNFTTDPLTTTTSSSSDPNSKKRRDWTKVVRKFHHEWTDHYLVIESVQHQKPLCLICHKMISAMKVHNIKRHYLQLHSAYFDHHFPAGSLSRKTELSRLIEDFRKNQELNQTFISILSTPDLYDLNGEEEDSEGEYDESSNGPGTNYNNNHSQQQQPPHPHHHQLHAAHYQQLKNSGLTVDKMERAFTHLDKFLAIIEQNDPNMQRSFKVRTAIEVVVDCYKHLLKDMKTLSQQQQQQHNSFASSGPGSGHV